jgi:hypothetical protein
VQCPLEFPCNRQRPPRHQGWTACHRLLATLQVGLTADHWDELTGPKQQLCSGGFRFEACARNGQRKDTAQELLAWPFDSSISCFRLHNPFFFGPALILLFGRHGGGEDDTKWAL